MDGNTFLVDEAGAVLLGPARDRAARTVRTITVSGPPIMIGGGGGDVLLGNHNPGPC